ncbi:hypothetical protein HYW21_02535 [Candidatus Woesearchaeota archaeon]|nr:hypothetical protein [Candidatus Woesearchaeota archaeon]
MSEKINSLGLGYAGAILAALTVLLLGIGGNIGVYTEAAEIMESQHMFFSLTIQGVITGMIEAAIFGFVGLYLLGWLYNLFI